MDFDQLRELSEKNEIRVDDFKGHKRIPPFYYDSLRNAFESYFTTFRTQNWKYDFYAEGLSQSPPKDNNSDYLDDENTVLAITSIERFFELFIKDILQKTNQNLICPADPNVKPKPKNTLKLIQQIQENTFVPKTYDGKLLTIPFRETLIRFYDLIAFTKDTSIKNSNTLVQEFEKVYGKYTFFDSTDNQSTLLLLSWYRDRILHNGNSLPSLWLLDYLFTQRIVPIVYELIQIEKNNLGNSLYYFETLTKIDILEKLQNVKFEFKDLEDPQKINTVFNMLLYIGHLKELGRANLVMGFFARNNLIAGYEYNYRDPQGRGKRFALAEIGDKTSEAKDIKKCPCCGIESLVLYQLKEADIVEWLKCYTCEYHLRYNARDPSLFKLSTDRIFQG